MWFSYHGGHSGTYCRHAKGTLAQVVDRAFHCGFTIYGLSEHCPRWRREDFFADEEDLTVEELEQMFAAYTVEARRLQQEYADRLELLVGFETEALPTDSWPTKMREIRDRGDFDYIIGSVHHVGGINIDESPGKLQLAVEANGGREQLERAYFELLAQVALELRPEVIGHIDLIRKFDGHEPRFSSATMSLIEDTLGAIRQVGAALEVNAAPHRRAMGPVYPMDAILRLAHRMNVPVTLGDDSHGPDDVGVGLDACLEAIARAGYRKIHYLTRRDGGLTELMAIGLDRVAPVR